MRLLKAVADGTRPASLHEAADRSEVNRSTAWRLLATLEHLGLIARDADQRYVVGFSAVHIAAAADQGTLARRARPLLERLVAETGETAGLSVPQHLTIVTIDQVDSPQVVTANWVGRRLPLHCSSNGKVLLASLSAEELDVFLSSPLESLTPATISDPAALRAELGLVRARAFLSVSGPAFRIPEPRLPQVGELVVGAAAELQNRIS